MGNCPYHIWITSFLLGNDHLSKNLAFSTPRTGLAREWHLPTQRDGIGAYKEMQQKMEAQASLQERVNQQLGTL